MKPQSDKEAIRLIMDGLRERDVRLVMVNDGEDEHYVLDSTDAALDAVMAVDEATLVLRLPDGNRAWAWFVLGNDPEEVVADHTVNLSEFIDPITEPWWNE